MKAAENIFKWHCWECLHSRWRLNYRWGIPTSLLPVWSFTDNSRWAPMEDNNQPHQDQQMKLEKWLANVQVRSDHVLTSLFANSLAARPRLNSQGVGKALTGSPRRRARHSSPLHLPIFAHDARTRVNGLLTRFANRKVAVGQDPGWTWRTTPLSMS